ncbi:MAG: hypothetical protein ACUVSY_15035, partial [Roseiflexus sp.]
YSMFALTLLCMLYSMFALTPSVHDLYSMFAPAAFRLASRSAAAGAEAMRLHVVFTVRVCCLAGRQVAPPKHEG